MRRGLVAVLTVLVAAAGVGVAQEAPTRQQSRSFAGEVSKRVAADYLLYLPPEYDNTSKSWPLLLFLHGAGERGSDLELVKRHGPPKIVDNRPLPFVIVSPQVPEGKWWSVDVLHALLEELLANLRIDRDRVYLTGLSMGGFGAWDLAMTYPDLFAAVVPICGGGNPVGVCRLHETPVWIFHGADDQAVPARWSLEMARRLRACNGNVRLTVYPGVGHDAWTQTYDNPELYEWLLQQRRGQATAAQRERP